MTAREIRDYVQIARQEPTTEHLEALWRAVFLLKGWYFLPAHADTETFPMVSLIDDEPWLLGFTNVRRLQEFARAHRRVNPDGSIPLLVLDPLDSINHLQEVQDHVTGVLFNIGSDETFRAPTGALLDYARHFGLPLDG